MLMPSIFANDLMDGFFDAPERNYKKNYYNSGLMKTDIKESKDGFEVIMDLPGFKKDEIKAELKDGYMTITAASDKDNKIESIFKLQQNILCRQRTYTGRYKSKIWKRCAYIKCTKERSITAERRRQIYLNSVMKVDAGYYF